MSAAVMEQVDDGTIAALVSTWPPLTEATRHDLARLVRSDLPPVSTSGVNG